MVEQQMLVFIVVMRMSAGSLLPDCDGLAVTETCGTPSNALFQATPLDHDKLEAKYSSDLFVARGTLVTQMLSEMRYKEIVNAVHELYEQIPAAISPNSNERARFVGCLLRNAGHDFMDFRQGGGGGSDGCMNFEDPDNRGITSCLKEFTILDLYERFSADVSLADFFVIIAEAAVGRAATGWSANTRWREDSLEYRLYKSFKYGRVTNTACEFAKHRMPNPEHGCEGRGDDKPGLKQIFVEHIFAGEEFPWALTAAISGAHTVGSAKLNNSGYDGYWSSAEQQGRFNNDYFKRIVMASWVPQRSVNGNSAKNQWQLGDQRRPNDHKEMMLTTDMCLAYAHTPRRSMCEEKMRAKAEEYFGFLPKKYDGHSWFCRYLFEHVGPEDEGRRWSEMYEDLDPTKHMCCAWVAPLSLLKNLIFPLTQPHRGHARFEPLGRVADESSNKTYSFEAQWDNTRREICGTDASFDESSTMRSLDEKDWRRKTKDGCCKSYPEGISKNQLEKECDNQYSARGHAFLDVMDFAREEFIFFKWFVKAWNVATERGSSDLKCVVEGCETKRDELTTEEKRACPMEAETWRNPGGNINKMIENNPSCVFRRIADTKLLHPDIGLSAPANWYALTRQAIPSELRKRGYNNYNIEDYFAITYDSATASSTGALEYEHEMTDMPPENLLKFSDWKKDISEGKTWNLMHNFKWDIDGRSSTCWASKTEKDPWIELHMTNTSTVHKVVLSGQYKNEMEDTTLRGATVYVQDGEKKPKACGTAYPAAEEKTQNLICRRPLTGNKIIVRYPGKVRLREKRLIVCMLWAWKWDEKYSGLMSAKGS